MLAQSYKSAADLGITEPQKEALMKTLVLLETGKLEHRNADDRVSSIANTPTFDGKFNMLNWQAEHPCGTVACIGGTAELIGNVKFDEVEPPHLYDLFQPRLLESGAWNKITPAQAATALRSYLTTGDAKWSEAVR